MTTSIKTYIIFLLITLVAVLGFHSKLSAQTATTYDQAIKLADKDYASGNLMDAKAYYQMALKFKQNDAYAKKKIDDIISKLSHKMDAEDAYYDIVDKADIYFDQQEFDKAIKYYRDALKVIPDDDYAKNQIKKILKMQELAKNKMLDYKKYMAEGNSKLQQNKFDEAIDAYASAQKLFPGNNEPAEKISAAKQMKAEYENRMAQFNKLTQEAGRYLLIKKYSNALKLYQKAQKLFPEKEDVAAKIKEITPKAKTQLEYDEKVAAADEFYINKNFGAAKAAYSEAAKLWPDNTYPTEMISKIDDQLALQRKDLDKNYLKSIASADSLFNLKNYEPALAEYNMALSLKPNEQYPKSKIEAINSIYAKQKQELKAQYSSIVSKADSLFAALLLDDAKQQYELALSIRPEDNYPKEQIKAIEAKAGELAAARKVKDHYDAVVAEAERLYKEGHFELAINKYKEAQVIESTADYPQKRIDEINMILANAAKAKKINESYSRQITLGTRLKQEKNYEEARKAFVAALQLKPNEQTPKDQIAEIDRIVLDREKKAAIDAKYNSVMKSADSLFALKEYQSAKLKYQQAALIKPDETEPNLRITKTEAIIANIENEAKLKKSYDAAILSADDYFANNRFDEAKVNYQKALTFKPDEKYPKDQISVIDKKLAEIAAENSRKFKETVVKADNFFDQAKYQDALLQYKIASGFKPDDKHCQTRIKACNTEIEEMMRKIKDKYNLAIADADRLYASKIFDKAIKAYRRAELIKPDDTYPEQMISKITKFIEENSIVDIINSETVINEGETKKFTFEPVRINVRKYNYILVRATNLDGGNVKLLFTYGSDNGKNGGFVINMVKEVSSNDYLIRVGNQYKWFSEDNNWITVLPQNGNVKIDLIRISKTN